MDRTYGRPGADDVRGAASFLRWLVVSQRGLATRGAVLGTLWMSGLAVLPYLLSKVIDDGLRSGRSRRCSAGSGCCWRSACSAQ